jgi:hypothetical protein
MESYFISLFPYLKLYLNLSADWEVYPKLLLKADLKTNQTKST